MSAAPRSERGEPFATAINSALVEIELEFRLRDEGRHPQMLALGTGELRAIVALRVEVGPAEEAPIAMARALLAASGGGGSDG